MSTPPLPRPTNLQSRKLLQRMCNRLALQPSQKLRHIHHGMFSCIFCGQPIIGGDFYRGSVHAARAHEICFKAVAREDWGAK